MFIEGAISGKNADVTEDNQLKTEAVTKTLDNYINGQAGKVWSLTFDGIDPAGANDKFFYMKNTGTETIRLTDFRVSSTVAGILKIKKVSGTPSYVGETAVTPVSRRSGRNPTLQATVNTDTDITGLTDGGTWFTMTLEAGKFTQLRTTSNIILDTGDALALEWDTATGVLTGTISAVENGTV